MITPLFREAKLSIGLVVSAGLLMCLAFTRQQAPQLNSLTEAELKDVVVHFERTTCYGSCEAYKLTIYGDGRVEYEGTDNVKVKGKQAGRLELADVKRIVSEFDKANYFSIDQYTQKHCPSCTLCTDMPTAITELKVKGTSHRVEHYYGCRCAPKSLWDLEDAIVKIVRTEQWTGDVSKNGPFGTTCFRQ